MRTRDDFENERLEGDPGTLETEPAQRREWLSPRLTKHGSLVEITGQADSAVAGISVQIIDIT